MPHHHGAFCPTSMTQDPPHPHLVILHIQGTHCWEFRTGACGGMQMGVQGGRRESMTLGKTAGSLDPR